MFHVFASTEKKDILLLNKRWPHLKHVVKEMHFMATEVRSKPKGRQRNNIERNNIVDRYRRRWGESYLSILIQGENDIVRLGLLLRELYNVQQKEQKEQKNGDKDTWILNMKVKTDRLKLARFELPRINLSRINHDAPGFKVLDQLSKVIAELFNRFATNSLPPNDLLVELNKWFTSPGKTCLGTKAWDFYCGERRNLNIKYVKDYVIGCKNIYKYLGGDLDKLPKHLDYLPWRAEWASDPNNPINRRNKHPNNPQGPQ